MSKTRRRGRTIPLLLVALLILGGAGVLAVQGPASPLAAVHTTGPRDAAPRAAALSPPGSAPVAEAAVALDATGDAALLAWLERGIATGRGTADDPLRLAGLTITAAGAALRIADSRLHVVVTEASLTSTHADAVVLESAENVTLEDVTAEGARSGLRAVGGKMAVVGGRYVGTYAGIEADADGAFTVQGATAVGVQFGVRIGGDGARLDDVALSVASAPDASTGLFLEGRGHDVRDVSITGAGYAHTWIFSDATTVARSTLTGPAQHAVVVQNARNVTLVGNSFTGPTGSTLVSFSTDALTVADNTFGATTGRAVEANQDLDLVVRDNTFSSAPRAVAAFKLSRGTVSGNTITGAEQAIDITDCLDTLVTGNAIQGASLAGISVFRSERTVVQANSLLALPSYGVFVVDGSSATTVSDNRFETVQRAVVLDGGAEATELTGNTFDGAALTSVTVLAARGATLVDNAIEDAPHGIYVSGAAEDVTVRGGRIQFITWGIIIDDGARDVVVSETMFLQNAVGIHVRGSAATLVANDLRQNHQALFFLGTQGATVHGNRIEDNRLGAHLANATRNLFYDNLFANDHFPGDQNTLLEQSDGNLWNITKTEGTNYLGGPWLGGNFWHDYQGPDADHDGLGDVPYRLLPEIPTLAPEPVPALPALEISPLDFHPLVPYEAARFPLAAPDMPRPGAEPFQGTIPKRI